MEPQKQTLEAAAWFGRHQAFAVIANKCSAAQAQCLSQLKSSRVFDLLGLTWDEFCKQYAGISRSQADRLIQQRQEFGDAYFRLSEIARIAPETYREIASHIEEDCLEIDGEKLPLTHENAFRIRAAIQSLRAQLRQARDTRPPASPGIIELKTRLDVLVDDLLKMSRRDLPDCDQAGLRGMLHYSMARLRRISHALPPGPGRASNPSPSEGIRQG